MIIPMRLKASNIQMFRCAQRPFLTILFKDKVSEARFSSSPYTEGSIPPPKPRRFFRKFLFLSLVSVSSFVALVYVSETTRNELISYYPPSKDILGWVENSIGGWYSPDSKVHQPVAPFSDFPLPPKQKSESTSQVEPVPNSKPVIVEKESHRLPTVEEVKDMTRQRHDQPVLKNIDFRELPNLVNDVESKVEYAKTKLKEFEETLVKYYDALRTAVQENNSVSREKNWDLVGKLEIKKDKIEKQVEKVVQQASQQLDELHQVIEQHKSSEQAIDSDIIPESIESYGRLQYELTGSINEVLKLQNDVSLLKRYRDLVASSHANLQGDLDALSKHIEQKKQRKDTTSASMSVDELNDLISVAHARIASLQDKLDHLEHSERDRMRSALETQRRADDSLRKEYIKQEVDRERTRHEIERHKWLREARDARERELNLALTRHSEHLSHMLQIERDKMEHQFQFRLREELAKERVAFEAALIGWTKRMEAIEDVIDGRADLDRLAKEAQSLWLSCEALACRLHSVSPTMKSYHDTKSDTILVNHTGSLKDFVNSIRECASSGNYPFASIILDSLSNDIVENGVWTENGLKKRFEKVYNVCRNVALIDETSGSLWEYVLSWLQSVLIIDVKYKCLQAISRIKPNIIGDSYFQYVEDYNSIKQMDSKPDSFQLLSSARFAMTNDHNMLTTDENTSSDEALETAVRLLGQLRGQSRVVANDWLVDARKYLEAKQTARALLAFAAARDISTLQKRL
ncbi:MICOS complex subunit Mic60 [Schistosoma japonicum]|uniref:MICOS complex subunit MIC60 n=2 Tax=Schistosoma japonicum TaxID=6182 RepID=A0A4Z2DLV0_SCHJA|nr:MICOS complex subunit Mic60 [Schistosoma japonicum]